MGTSDEPAAQLPPSSSTPWRWRSVTRRPTRRRRGLADLRPVGHRRHPAGPGPHRRRVEPGDRVAIHLEPANALRWIVAYAAIHRAGAVAVPFNPQLARPEVERMLDHSGAVGGLRRGVAAPPLRRPAVRRWWWWFPPRRPTAPTARPVGPTVPGCAWSQLMDHDPTTSRYPGNRVTSPTSSTPRVRPVIPRRWRSAMTTPRWSPSPNRVDRWRWLHASPPYTFAGLSFIYTPMKLGHAGLYLPSSMPTVARRGRRRRPVSVFLVPAMANLLLEHPRFDTAALVFGPAVHRRQRPAGPVRAGATAGADAHRLVSNNYGMTEAGSVYCIMPPGEAVKRPGSVGSPLPPAEVRCTDAEGRPLPPARWAMSSSGSRARHGSTTATRRPRPVPGSTAGWSPATWAGSTRTATCTSSAGARTSSSGGEQHPPDRRRACHRIAPGGA